MRCVLSILIVVLGILPSASYAKTGWHLKHYPQTGDMLTSYWAAQMENIPVVTKSESRFFPRRVLLFSLRCKQ